MTEDKPLAPQKTKGDTAHAIVKAELSAVPVIYGPFAELFQHVMQPPLEEQRAKWIQKVGEKLCELGNKGFNIEELRENEEFISDVMFAAQIALITHQNEKIQVLHNTILNIAKSQASEEALQNVFLNLIESFTELHLRILKLFQNHKSSPSNVFEHNIPELRGRSELYDQTWKDLYSRGLVNTDCLNTTILGHGLWQKHTTDNVDTFLKFIE